MTAYNADLIAKRANKTAHGDARSHQSQLATMAITVAPVAGDTYAMIDLPAYARVIGAEIDSDRLDTGTAVAFSVGDNGYGTVAADTARYFATTTIGRVAGPADANASSTMNGRAQNFWNNQPTNLRVFATCLTAPTTFAAGNLRVRVTYYIDEPASALNQ